MASCSGNGSRGHHRFTLNVDETYVSGGAENYSTVSWSLVLSPIQTGWDWNYSSTVPVSYKVTINGTDYTGNIMSYDGRSTVTIRSGTQNVTHNNDGSKSIDFSFSVWDNISASFLPGPASGNASLTLTNIPRYTTITTFSVAKRNETSVTVTWGASDACDKIWYSINNGSSWIETSGYPNFIIDGLTPNTTYNFKLRVRRMDSRMTTDSWNVSQTTNQAPNQSLNSKTETTITMNWFSDTVANHIYYSIDNGSNWIDVGDVNSTSGSYTITGLTANTTYDIQTRVKRSGVNTTYDTPKSSQTTYAYPYCTDAPDFTIGDNVTLKLYNPLNRTVQIQMWSHVNQQFVSELIEISGTSYTGFSGVANRLYASIPNTNQSQYNIDVWYGSNKTIKEGGNYSIIGTELPTFNNFSYRDSNSVVSEITGNDQVMVKGLSTPEITISSANKMVANNSASGKNYSMTIGNLSGSIDYSTEDIVKQLGTINTAGTQRLTVTAFDSRNLSTSANKDVVVYDYSKPVINASVTRLNNFENETTLKIAGTYNKLTINDVDKNSMSSVKYRYKQVDSSFNNWTSVTITSSTNGTFTCSDIILNLDNTKSFEFEVSVSDALDVTIINSYVLDVGKSAFFIKKDGGFESNGDSQINGNLLVNGNLEITGNSQFDGDLSVIGNSELEGDLSVNGDSELNGNLLVSEDTQLDGNLSVNGRAYKIFQHHGEIPQSDFDLALSYGTYKVAGIYANAPITTENIYGILLVYESRGLTWEYADFSSWIWQTLILTDGRKWTRMGANYETLSNWGREYTQYSLYSNTAGNSGSITISESAAYFECLDIFFKDQEGNYSSIRIYEPDGKRVSLDISVSNGEFRDIWAKVKGISVSGTSISIDWYGEAAIAEHTYYNNNYIYITKIVGWR